MMLSAWGRAWANALWSHHRAAAEPAEVQVLEAVVVPDPSRAEVLEEEEDVEEDMRVLRVMSSGGSVAEGSIGEGLTEEELVGGELLEEELAGEAMEKMVEKAPAVEAGEYEDYEPHGVEVWEEIMRGEAFLRRVCRGVEGLMEEGRLKEANVLWERHLPMPLRPKWGPVLNEYRRQYKKGVAEGK
ncbi:hypothetical protein I7I48_12344 [Histoplasma ohiense]|nr:hypothetical protein I7I48_12344 [Histoplasma ohiense (nom. inval.)]